MLYVWILALFLFSQVVQAKVETFSPQGITTDVDQIKVRFDTPMVKFGDPRAESPFAIDCVEKGSDRWLDDRNWVYDFKDKLPGGATCKFTLRNGLKDLAGKLITSKVFEVSTGGPKIIETNPYSDSSSIAEDEVFILTTNAPVDRESVEKSVIFKVQGLSEVVPVSLLTDAEFKFLTENSSSAKRYKKLKKNQFHIGLKAKRTFPQDADVSLVWGTAVKSKTGVKNHEVQTFNFHTRPEFRATMSCVRENEAADCSPVGTVTLNFSEDIPIELAKATHIELAKGKKIFPQGLEDNSSNWANYLRFPGPLPPLSALVLRIPEGVKDPSGRGLANANMFPLKFKTADYPPLAKFSATFGIIEWNKDSAIPVTLRNLESSVKAKALTLSGTSAETQEIKGKQILVKELSRIVEYIKRAEKSGQSYTDQRERPIIEPNAQVKEFKLPKASNDKDFRVVGIPVKEPGFHVVELESARLGDSLLAKRSPMFVPTTVLVTNMAVHLKNSELGKSMAWVTELDSGKPVAGAKVTVVDCSGKSFGEFTTDNSGITFLSNLPRRNQQRCGGENSYSELDTGYFVFAARNDDISFVHSSWEKGIESWRMNLSGGIQPTEQIAHTILDRSLLRAGDTVHMKHIVRDHGISGMSVPKKFDRVQKLQIEHEGTNQKFTFTLKWDASGIAETNWKIPESAKLGTYRMHLLSSGQSYGGNDVGSFRVAEFRVPLTRSSIQTPSTPQVKVKDFPVDLNVSYLSGGGASIDVKARYQIEEASSVTFNDYSDYAIANGEVIEGKQKTKNYSYSEDGEIEDDANDASAASTLKVGAVRRQDLTLDRLGNARVNVDKLPLKSNPYDVLTELEYTDPNGEIQTTARRTTVFPSSTLVGIKQEGWMADTDNLKVRLAVFDLKGKPLANRSVKVETFLRKYQSHRKRLMGSFYAYDSFNEVTRLGTFCEGKSDSRGELVCDGKSSQTGNIIFQATTADDSGNLSRANREIWVVGKDAWWFEPSNGDRMDVLAERKSYEPGEKAKLQVRMPFKEATALVTIEREGVVQALVTKLTGKDPVIEIPILDSYAPNVFVSVMAVRGRVNEPQPTALVDLGKPSFKIGVAEVKVGWRRHSLDVKVASNKEVYKIREKALVTIAVKSSDGSILPSGSEVAIAAVDEGLLELAPNYSWKILDYLMGSRANGVETSSAQTQVIGKRHFGLKAIAHGGGGGKKPTREMFDTLLYWNGRVQLDSQGQATVEIPLNDSLTSFKIVAIANSATDRFGTGSVSIRTTQDLMILPGLPRLVREGDKLRAIVTVRNASSRAMPVSIQGFVLTPKIELPKLTKDLAAGEAHEFSWDVAIPYDVSTLKYQFSVSGTEGVSDSLDFQQSVIAATPVRTFQATISQLNGSSSLEVERPKDALQNRGGLRVTLNQTLISSLEGVKEYMKLYPYNCMEQRVSRAIALQDKQSWKSITGAMPSYFDSYGLLKYFPSDMLRGSDSLTSYVYAISHAMGWQLPDDVRTRMQDGLTSFILGKIPEPGVNSRSDYTIRKIAALSALSRDPAFRADPSMISQLQVAPNQWPNIALIDWIDFLKRAKDLSTKDKWLSQALQVLKSRYQMQGTIMNLSQESNSFEWLMNSVEQNNLRGMLLLMDQSDWAPDMGRIAQGAIKLQKKGHWGTTTGNAWGVVAVKKFAEIFEKTPVKGSTEITLEKTSQTANWPAKSTESTFNFPWPQSSGKLTLKHNGDGKPWSVIQSLAAIPLSKPLLSGFSVERSMQPVDQKTKGVWSKGDVYRISLKCKSNNDVTWVVVNDPIPSGATILGSGLGGASSLFAAGEKASGNVWTAFTEKASDSFRSYYEYVPKGEWSVEYTVRLNNPGVFNLPTTRVEAMYSPEMFAELPNAPVEVKP